MTGQYTQVSGGKGITVITLSQFQGSKAGIKWQKKGLSHLYLTGEEPHHSSGKALSTHLFSMS